MAMLTRKGNHVTGPKYFACGLEKSGLYAGNEMECDLIISQIDQKTPQLSLSVNFVDFFLFFNFVC